MGSFSRLDRFEMAAASRLVARLERFFYGRRWLRNAVAATLVAVVVVVDPIESIVEGISGKVDDD